jgi:valyl-tRNA synthetase
MEKEISKVYEPSQYEDEIYKKWEQSGFFNPDKLAGEQFSIMMPPPNVTGVLHLGHALENSLMDAMIRFQRMQGKKTLLLPGTDHAAVATQAKVEKILVEQGIKNPRQELGREKLLEKIREYAENSKATILKQIKKMGASCDWSRLAYTFDEDRTKAVNEIFIKMYNDGLIYQGYRVVNWSVKGQSTCSDDELVHIERPAKLYYFKYSEDFPITIATTRPETKLGDTAVAVNPKDKRYKKYIGQVFVVDVGAEKPLELKIIADKNVDPSFGTGALGLTPAHSAVDYEMYEKQKAKNDPINLLAVIGADGRMTKEAGKDYENLAVEEARGKFIKKLKADGLFEKEEDIIQNVGTSDRFGDIVEALPMTQWFIDVNKKIPDRKKSLKELMREAVETGHKGDTGQKINITPERFEKIYFNWIDNLRDWCISRQIWWGHRIPAWYNKKNEDELYVGAESPKGEGWVQDEDTLDTWFSSGLWTFSTLGWPANQKSPFDKGGAGDLATFHPTSWMQMGYEILFFWMARMILMSAYVLDEIPFKNVYIHGILRDEKGKKFSKSSGNAIDPIEVAKKYGTDALRLSLLSGIAPGSDSRFYEEKVAGARNLVNKLWNISRYIISNIKYQISNAGIEYKKITLADRWILAKMEKLIKEVTDDFNNYRFSQAEEKLREFTRDYLADWYLEVCKFEKSDEKGKILNLILKDLLKLWHPFIPFVTEKIWEEIGGGKLLMIEKWPDSAKATSGKLSYVHEEGNGFELIKNIITAIRNARAENKIKPGKKIKAVMYVGKNIELIKSQQNLIKSMRTGIGELEIKENGDKIKEAIYIAIGEIEIYLIGGRDEIKEKIRIKKEIENLEKAIKGLKGKLGNKEFLKKAPAEIVKQEKEKFKRWEKELEKLKVN